jgi:hypothetical protein
MALYVHGAEAQEQEFGAEMMSVYRKGTAHGRGLKIGEG